MRVFAIVLCVVAASCWTLPVHTLAQPMVGHDALGTLTQVIPPRGDYVPDLAAMIVTQNHIKPVQDPQGSARYHVTIPLRRDLFLSDGTELTADDIVASYASILSTHTDGASTHTDEIETGQSQDPWTRDIIRNLVAHVEATDEFTVRFWLKWMPGIGEWQYGLLQHPIVVARQEVADANHGLSIPSRDFENIVLFKNGSVAISNPVTGYAYLSAQVGGDVERSFERKSLPYAKETSAEYYLGFNLHQGPMTHADIRWSMSAIIQNGRQGDVISTQPLKLLGPAAHTDPEGAMLTHKIAARLTEAGLSVNVIQEEVRPLTAIHHLTASKNDYDLIILRHDVGALAAPDSLAELFAKAQAIHRWATALGLTASSGAESAQYRASLDRLIAALSDEEVRNAFDRWMKIIENSVWMIPVGS